MKHFISFHALRLSSVIAFLLMLSLAVNGQTVLAYWAQNNNGLPGGGFGFTPASFPQAADLGAGSLSLQNFDTTLNASGAYQYIQSFTGTTLNAEAGFPSGGSLSPQGGAGLSNNGMSIRLDISTAGYENVVLSWAWQRTSSGFNSVQISYSTDGVTFTNFGSPFTPPTSFGVQNIDFSSL